MLSGCVMSVCGYSLVFLAMFLCGDDVDTAGA